MGTKKSNKLYAAAAALAVTASAVAPGLSADAATKVTVKSITAPKAISHYGGSVFAVTKLSLPKTVKVLLSNKKYENRAVTWTKVSYDVKNIGKYQTLTGTVAGTSMKTSIKVKLNNYPVDVVEPKLAPVAVGEAVKLPSTIDVKYKDGKVVARSIKSFNLSAAPTDKVGAMKISYNYMGTNSSIKGTIGYDVKSAQITNVKNEVKDDMLSVSADVKYPAKDAKVALLVYPGKDTSKAITVDAELKDGKFMAKSAVLPAGTHAFSIKIGEVVSRAKEFVVEAPMVKEVKAINAKQLQVTFNKAIDSSVVDSNGTIIDNTVTLSKVTGLGTGVVGDESEAKLSEDKKSVIIDADNKLEGQYVVTLAADKIKAVSGGTVASYTSGVFNVEDKVAPTVASVTNLSASVVRVKFSEPLKEEGSWTFKLADGSNASVTQEAAFAAGDEYIDLKLGSDVANGAQITATILGSSDYAGNLISPNPTTINFVKGVKDGAKPSVTSVTPIGLDKFEVKFSEKVQNVSIEDFTITGKTITDVDQDATDATKYIVTFSTALAPTAGQTSVLATVGVNATSDTPTAGTNIMDLSGERFDGFSRIVEFKKDAVAPKLVKSEVKKENGEEYLFVTFDEVVQISAPNALDALVAKQVKDFVTTSGVLDVDGSADDALTQVSGDTKSWKVKLSELRFTPNGGPEAALIQGAEYTLSLAGLKDSSNNELASTDLKLVRGADLDTTKPVPTVGAITNDTIQVSFDRPLDGASAINKANYSINGLAIDSVTLKPNNLVELKLAEGTNSLNGVRNLMVSNVKSKDGVVMNDFVDKVNLKENVKPTITKAEFVDLSTIRVTFSEDVKYNTVAGDATADFGLKLDGAEFTGGGLTEVMAANGKTMTISLTAPVDATQYAKTLTLVPATGFAIQDLNDNSGASFTSVTVSK